jgi:ankyrin repeat protein
MSFVSLYKTSCGPRGFITLLKTMLLTSCILLVGVLSGGCNPTNTEQTGVDKPTRQQELLLAIGVDDYEQVAFLLEGGADPNTLDMTPDTGLTPLMITESPEILQLLLSRGADPNRADCDGAAPLHYAVVSEKALVLIPLLCDAGAHINAAAPGRSNETPLLTARQWFFGSNADYGERVVRLLVSRGAGIDAADASGYTLLISAVVNRKEQMAQCALDLGADVTRTSSDGITALGYADELGFTDIAALLRKAGATE